MTSAAALAVLVALLVGSAASAARGELILVNRADGLAGLPADGTSGNPSISADGRFVAFQSSADNLSLLDDDDVSDVFVRDLQNGTTTLVSQANGVGGDATSFDPSISADGRFVAFDSEADNLSTDDNASFDVFVRDLQKGTTTLVSQASGVGGDGHSIEPSISPDGRFVAFESSADNLSTGDDDSVGDVFVRDLQAGTTTLVSQANGVGGDGHSFDASISADGRVVAFTSFANNLAGGKSGVADVFVRDLEAETTRLVSQIAFFGAGDDTSFSPSISADGRFVAFASRADNFSFRDEDDVLDVYVRDLEGLGMTLVSEAGGVGGDATSSEPSISADGRFVAFESDADNLSTDDNDSFFDVFVRDLQNGTNTLVSQANGVGGDGDSFDASISADGRFVALQSDADNLGAAATDFTNVFRRDLRGDPPRCSDVAHTVAREAATTLALTCADADGDPITRSIVRPPAHGTLGTVDQASGTVSYTPNPGFAGPDSFSFQGSDAAGASNTATASLTVPPSPPSSPPVDRVAPVVSGFAVLPARFRLAAESATRGSSFRFRLSERATTRIVIERVLRGRTKRRQAATLTHRNRPAGRNRIAFRGRIGGRALPRGSYIATITATDPAGNRSKPRRTSFRVVRR